MTLPDDWRDTVLVIAKTPEPGRVKTRLCPPCSAEQAAAIASAALADTFAAVAATDAHRRVVALDGEPGPWIPRDFEIVGQVTGGLGDRLEAAFRWLSRTGTDRVRCSPSIAPAGAMIVLGMDTPQVTAEQVADALATMRQPGVDAVLGPALDGGYWTVGFTAEVVARCHGLFEGVPMSSERTAEAQLARLESLGLSCRVLHSERDMDTWDDAVALARGFPGLRTTVAVGEVLDGQRTARAVQK